MTDDDPLARFERAARRARDEAPPPLDVTDAVLARVRTPEPLLLDPRERTTWLCLAASLAVAVTATWAGADAWSTLTDPLDAFMAAMTTEVP